MRTSVSMFCATLFMLILCSIFYCITSYSSYRDIVQQNLDESIEFSVNMLQKDMKKSVAEADKLTVEHGFGYSETDLDSQLTKNSAARVDIHEDLPTDEVDDDSVRLKNEETNKNTALKEDFVKDLTMNLDSTVNRLDVEIYGADASDGLLSVEVTAFFKYPTGNYGTVSSYKTVILDKYVKD